MKRKGEKGYALLLVLLLLLVGMIILAPLMSFMATGLLAGQQYELMMERQYAADGGVEQALWKIKNGQADATPFSVSLNGCVVDVEIEVVLTERTPP